MSFLPINKPFSNYISNLRDLQAYAKCQLDYICIAREKQSEAEIAKQFPMISNELELHLNKLKGIIQSNDL